MVCAPAVAAVVPSPWASAPARRLTFMPSFLERMILSSSVFLHGGDGVIGERHETGVLPRVELPAEVDRLHEVRALIGGERDALVLGVHRRGAVGERAVRRREVQLLDEGALA